MLSPLTFKNCELTQTFHELHINPFNFLKSQIYLLIPWNSSFLDTFHFDIPVFFLFTILLIYQLFYKMQIKQWCKMVCLHQPLKVLKQKVKSSRRQMEEEESY